MKVFIDGINGYFGWNFASQIGGAHELSGVAYTPREGEFSRQPAVDADRLAGDGDDAKLDQLLGDADVIIVPALRSLPTATNILKRLTQLNYTGRKTFICVSSVLTWARTPTTQNKPLEESAFKTRRSPVKYQDLKNFENIVLNCNSSKLQTIVVGAGVTYGNGESILETFFRDAWLFPTEMLGVPAFGKKKGQNVIPMVHIVDLSRFVANLVKPEWDISSKRGLYVLSMDESRTSLVAAITAISRALGSGKVRNLVDFEIQDLVVDNPPAVTALQVHLEFNTSAFYSNGMTLEWHCRGGLVSNIETVVKEFVEFRGLIAPRISVVGPPGLDARALAAHLSDHYKLPCLSEKNILKEMMEIGEGEDVEDEAVLAVVEHFAGGKKGKKGAPKPMTPEQIAALFRWKLAQAECRNKGWVMVNFPSTAEDAHFLCTNTPSGTEAEAGDNQGVQLNALTTPTKLIMLDAVDSDLEQRVAALSDEAVSEQFGDVQSFQKAVALYRSVHGSEGNVNETEAQFFLESQAEIDALNIIMKETEAPEAEDEARPDPESVTAERVVDTCCLYIENGMGKPFNYRPTRKEKEEMAKRALGQAEAERESKQLQAEETRHEETLAREKQQLELENRRNEYIRQEMQMLERRAMPLRQYLMDSVVPVLTKGLMEVCKSKPRDPVDYLAEWLFRNNPDDLDEAANLANEETTSATATANPSSADQTAAPVAIAVNDSS